MTKCHLALAHWRLAEEAKQGGSEVEKGSQHMRLFTPDRLTVQALRRGAGVAKCLSTALFEPHDFTFHQCLLTSFRYFHVSPSR